MMTDSQTHVVGEVKPLQNGSDVIAQLRDCFEAWYYKQESFGLRAERMAMSYAEAQAAFDAGWRAGIALQLREIEQLRGENAVLAGILSDCDNVLATIVADDIDEAEKIGALRMALAYALDPYKREGTLL